MLSCVVSSLGGGASLRWIDNVMAAAMTFRASKHPNICLLVILILVV